MRNQKKKHPVLHWDIFAVPMILFIVSLQIWIFQQLQIHCISKHMDGCWNWLHLNFTLQHKQNNDQTSCAWLHCFSNVAVLYQKLLQIQWSRKGSTDQAPGLMNLDRTGPMGQNWPISHCHRPLLGEWRPLWPITIYIGSQDRHFDANDLPVRLKTVHFWLFWTFIRKWPFWTAKMSHQCW